MSYDLIIIGSGNGACGFLSKYLSSCTTPADARILVLEEGDTFFNVSDFTHQNNWTKAYAEKSIFLLHNCTTEDGKPIIAGRATAFGGGGSINYTMIHEASSWLTAHLGQTDTYWDNLKTELNAKFDRPDPQTTLSPVAALVKTVTTTAASGSYTLGTDMTGNIPNAQADTDTSNILHAFPSQFNTYGQRTNSGLSIVDWTDSRLTVLTCTSVTDLIFTSSGSSQECTGVKTKNVDTGDKVTFSLTETTGRVIMCAGALTPRLLMPHRDDLVNTDIGLGVSDHILLPLGIYMLPEDMDVTGKDVYVPWFASSTWVPTDEQKTQGATETLCCLDFFSGQLQRLWFMLAHLYLAFILSNKWKTVAMRVPFVFYVVSTAILSIIQAVTVLWNVYCRAKEVIPFWLVQNWPDCKKVQLITAIIKFNPRVTGEYASEGDNITLKWFHNSAASGKPDAIQDKTVASDIIKANIAMLDTLGDKPPASVCSAITALTGIPYAAEDVDAYVDRYCNEFLLSEQHLAGGACFGSACDDGSSDASCTGRVVGSTNVHVADLSGVNLPRISPQMTAYLMGYHVAGQLTAAAAAAT